MADPFDRLTAATDPALIVVTTAAEGHRAGCLVGFHSQSSIDPQRCALWLSKANHTYRVALRATHLGVHFLTADDLPLAEHFGTQSGDDVDKLAGIELDVQDGVPLLRACPHRLLVEKLTLLDDGGDHVCLSTRVLSAWSTGDLHPLRVSDAVHLTPGHESDERAIEP